MSNPRLLPDIDRVIVEGRHSVSKAFADLR